MTTIYTLPLRIVIKTDYYGCGSDTLCISLPYGVGDTNSVVFDQCEDYVVQGDTGDFDQHENILDMAVRLFQIHLRQAYGRDCKIVSPLLEDHHASIR